MLKRDLSFMGKEVEVEHFAKVFLKLDFLIRKSFSLFVDLLFISLNSRSVNVELTAPKLDECLFDQ